MNSKPSNKTTIEAGIRYLPNFFPKKKTAAAATIGNDHVNNMTPIAHNGTSIPPSITKC